MGVLVNIENGAHHNAIMNNKFIGHPTISKSTQHALIYSEYGNSVDSMNFIFGNEFENGSYGVYFASIDNSNLERGNTVYNCKFTNTFDAAVYMYFSGFMYCSSGFYIKFYIKSFNSTLWCIS